MSPRRNFSDGEIQMILSAICFFRAEKEKCGDKRYPVYDFVSKCLNIGERTVKKYASEYRENIENGTSPSKKARVVTGRPKLNVDQFTVGAIRRYIYDFYVNKMFPTIDKLRQKLEDSIQDFPVMTTRTLTKIVKQIGFRFKKLNRKPVLMESVSVAASRNEYLRKIRSLRSQGYKIFYTDETWCGQNHTMHYGWQDKIAESLDFATYDQFRGVLQEVNGWRGGFKTPTGAGQLVIILHISSEDGFLPGGELCFVGKKGTSDYHNEMNSQHFQEWFKRVVGFIPRKSAIVIDQAPYHKTVDPEKKNPTMSWLKKDIIEWLNKRNIALPQHATDYTQLTKAALIEHAKPYFGVPKNVLENIIEEINPGVKLIWLPVAHCELNAIELIWAFVKNSIAKVNRRNAAENGNSITVTRDLCKQVLSTVTPDLWKKCIRHAEDIETQYWEKDHLTDEVPLVEPVVVNLQEDSDSDSDTDFEFNMEGEFSGMED